VLRLLDPSITAAGVLRAERIIDAVRDILGEAAIEDLPIPYTAVSTDLISGRSVWLRRGPVDEAIQASIAIPGVIAPHVLDGRLLADGGILDPLPMAPIAAANADVTIAVSLSGTEAGGRFDSTASRSGDSDAELVDAGNEADVPKLGSFEVMNRTIDIAQAALARHTLAAYPPICSSRCHEHVPRPRIP
jgi:NTE family protein